VLACDRLVPVLEGRLQVWGAEGAEDCAEFLGQHALGLSAQEEAPVASVQGTNRAGVWMAPRPLLPLTPPSPQGPHWYLWVLLCPQQVTHPPDLSPYLSSHPRRGDLGMAPASLRCEEAGEAAGCCFVPSGLYARLVPGGSALLAAIGAPRGSRHLPQAGVLAEHGRGRQSAGSSTTLPACLAHPGFIIKNTLSGGAYSRGNIMPRTALCNQGTALDHIFYCTSQPVPSSAPGSLMDRGKLKTTQFITSKEQVLLSHFQFLMQLASEAGGDPLT